MPISSFAKHRACTFLRNNAAIPAIAIIFCVEIILHPYLSEKFFSHEVDVKLASLERKERNQAVVTIGDSVGHGIFSGWRFKNGSIAQLACNQATETTGQYFFVQRFIAKNQQPEVIISCDRSPFSGNLTQNLTENYVQRCFTKWREIIELMAIKMDPVFTLKMISYKLFATFKYRLHVQEKLVGFRNGEIYTGLTINGSSPVSTYGLIDRIENYKNGFRQESISAYFLTKLIAELQKQNIPFYYLPPPTNATNKRGWNAMKKNIERFEELAEQFDNVHILTQHSRKMSGDLFADEVHLSHSGLSYYRPHVQADIEKIIAEARQRRFSSFQEALDTSSPIFTLNLPEASERLTAIRDVRLQEAKDSLILLSTGDDPSILLPSIPKTARNKPGKVVVHVQISSSHATIAQLYFGRSGKEFSERNSLKKRILPGINDIKFILPGEFDSGNLRFDPAKMAGKFNLKGLEVKVVRTRLKSIDSIVFDEFLTDAN